MEKKSGRRVGRRARSIRIGSCPAFEGEIVFDAGRYVYMAGPDGTLWHREASDFTLIPRGAPAVLTLPF